jgi:phage terminase large subunit
VIELNPVFKPVFTTDKRVILLTGGRGAAKSFGINTVFCLITYEKGHRILHTRWTMASADISIIPEFKEKISLLEVEPDFNIKEKEIINRASGSEIFFRGLKTSSGNQTASLKSIAGLTDLILEEAEEIKEEKTYDDLNLSVRGMAAQNRIVIILNPTTIDHWIYQKWFKDWLTYIEIDGEKIPISAHPDILHLHLTYFDNLSHLPQQFIDEMRQLKVSNPRKYRHTVLGGWLEKAEGVIFENWEEGEFDTALPYCYGLDLGFFPNPCALIKVAVSQKRKLIFLKEVAYEHKLSTQGVLDTLKRIEKKRDLINSDKDLRLYNEIKRAGFNINLAIKGPGSIVNDIRDMQDYKMIVDPKSYNLKKELNNYVWNDKKASIPIDAYNDLLDAARYGFRRLVPRKASGVKHVNR